MIWCREDEKRVNDKAFKELEHILQSLKQGLKNNNVLSKKLVKIIFFVYVQLDTEAGYCEYDHPLFRRVIKIESLMSEIFEG